MHKFLILFFYFSTPLVHAEKWGDTDLQYWQSGDWHITVQDYGNEIGKSCYLLGEGINTEGTTASLWIYPTGEEIDPFSKQTKIVALATDVGLSDIKTYENQTDDVVAIFPGDHLNSYRVGSQAFYVRLKEQQDKAMFVVKAKNRKGKMISMTFSPKGLLSARDFVLDKCW